MVKLHPIFGSNPMPIKWIKWRLIRSSVAAFLLLCVFASSSLYAATFSARISDILFYETGDLVYIYVEGGTQQKPACAGSNGDYLSFSLSRPRAKEYLAGLMMAFSSGKTVSFWTRGACIDQSVSDTIYYFVVHS